MYKAPNSEFRQDQKHTTLSSIAATVAFSFIVGSANLLAASDLVSSDFNQDMLAAVAELHGITEDQAVERLVRETEAAITLRLVRDRSIASYAGSWFDADSMKLKVAIADSDDLILLKGLKVEPVIVNNSLAVLKDKLLRANEQLDLQKSLDSAIVKSYVDIRNNTAILAVDTLYANSARSVLDTAEFSGLIEVKEQEGDPILSTGPVRAADGTHNLTWIQDDGEEHPCSVGAPVEDGFVTAGHCGYAGNSIGDVNETSMGVVQDSQWENTTYGPDIGYVETITGWTPTAQVNGYTDGNFAISAEWSGMVEYPVGSTICRYGQTSGGPHCGTLDQTNVNVVYPAPYNRTLVGISQSSGGCTSDGDSGGTHVAGTGQIQGIHIGGQPAGPGNHDCPVTLAYMYFQPLKDALDEYNVTLLTEHGASAPSVNFAMCPNMLESGGGHYQCELRSADSQGEIGLLWTTNTGHSSTSMELSGSCSFRQTVNVTLKMTNPYGNTYKYYSFLCPSIPNQ